MSSHTDIDPRLLFSDPRIYVATWLTQQNVTLYAGALRCPQMRRRDQLEDSMWLDYISQLAAYNRPREPRERISGFKDKDMSKSINEYIERQQTAAKLAQLAALAYDPGLLERGTDQLAGWVASVEAEPSALTMKVMQHWIWMVKRKLAGKGAVHHIMPILVGASQGKGKSTAIRKLYSPVNELAKEMTANFFEDDRNAFAFADTFVGFLDELANLNTKSVEQVKRIITLDVVSSRRLRTNDVYVIPQNTSFIGTSNKSVGLIVNDTQMRRFYEIVAAETMDWQTINQLDYLSIFRSIDDSLENGYIADCLDELRVSQQELATPEPLAMFVEDHEIKPGKAKQVSSTALYEKYRTWCEANGNSPLNSAWFSKRLKALGFELKKDKNKHKVFWLSEESKLGALDIYPQPATVHHIGGNS